MGDRGLGQQGTLRGGYAGRSRRPVCAGIADSPASPNPNVMLGAGAGADPGIDDDLP